MEICMAGDYYYFKCFFCSSLFGFRNSCVFADSQVKTIVKGLSLGYGHLIYNFFTVDRKENKWRRYNA